MKKFRIISNKSMVSHRKHAGLLMSKRFAVFQSGKHGTGWEKEVTLVRQRKQKTSKMLSSISK